MIVLDTNVVSEVMRPAPSPTVLAWLNGQDTVSLYLTSVTIAEIEYGICVFPAGQRQGRLAERFQRFVTEAFEGRVLSFDQAAARIYGEIMADRKPMGRPMSIPDGQIAAIARLRGYAVATRNIRDFENCGIELIDPFAES